MSIELELEGYTLEQELGRGDLTIVYQAHRKSDKALVAVKVVGPQFTFDDYFVRRFKDITRQTIKLEHPNIVRTYEAGQEGDKVYVVREMINGRSLAEILEEEGPFSPQRMVNIARQIAAALDYAHQKSMMHGDLSASRVYMGENDHVTVADFGQMQAIVGSSLSKQGYAVGSPEILAPERVRGQGPSRQSDLYSLGILCYQMLNGAPPFSGAPAAVLHAQAYEQPRPLHIINPGVSVPLSEAIGRMLSKGLELRYNTGSEFVRALTVASEGAAPVRGASVARTSLNVSTGAPTSLWRRPWLWAIIAAPVIIILLVVGFLGVSAWVALQPPLAIQPTEIPSTSAAPNIAHQTPAPAEPPSGNVDQAIATTISPLPTPLPAISPTDTPTATPTDTPPPSPTPTLVPFPTPGPPVVSENSPFTNLKVARGITANNQPEKVGLSFAPGAPPIYLFFDYANIEPGTAWGHRWVWGDAELGVYDDVWPDNYFETGVAWVFYSPTGGYQPGPYQVTLTVQGQTVATATFVIEPGGL